MSIRITGTGMYVPEQTISNQELVSSLNAYVERYNDQHDAEIQSGTLEPLKPSTAEFIEKASGIESRHVVEKEGILDINRMRPCLREREDHDISLQAEMGVAAAKQAMREANISADEVDAVILASLCSQRAYPSVAVEIQHALGIDGFAFDMTIACAAATFGISQAVDMIKSGKKCILVVNVEIMSGQVDYTSRDSHFIFGDAASAVVIEHTETKSGLEIIDTKLKTTFSNHIRNNFGFLNHCEISNHQEKLFYQDGRKVFKEVSRLVAQHIRSQLNELNIELDVPQKFWLHQANANMNKLILKLILGSDDYSDEISPMFLKEFGNTSSAGVIIALHQTKQSLKPDDIGVLCSFGAGYAIGSLILKKL